MKEENNNLTEIKWNDNKTIISTIQIQLHEENYLLALDVNGIFYMWNLSVIFFL